MNKLCVDKMPIYRLENVEKTCSGPVELVHILNSVNLVVNRGDSLAIIGASGSGKSTLLHILGLLDTQTSGQVLFDDREIKDLSGNEKALLRNKRMGFVFQFHHLLPEFSTEENVAMQAIIGGMDKKKAFKLAEQALERVELGHRRKHNVDTLSGGERQRAAIARAILLEPAVLLADEPTGNLDDKTGRLIGNLLLQLNKNLGMTMIMVTHNHELSQIMERSCELRSGELYEQKRI